jgi:hypothetical protein
MFTKAALLTLAASAHAFAIPSDGAEPRARPFAYDYVATPNFDGEGCYWLKRRAIATSSPYWWQRYRRCRGD